MKLKVIKFLNSIRFFIEKITPDYWICYICGDIKFKEEELYCWNCGIGEMIYKGQKLK